MQKFIRIMAIVATALVGISLLALILTVPFQRVFATGVYGLHSSDVLDLFPQFPWMQLLSAVLRLGVVGLLIFCCGNSKGGIWLEILVFSCLAVVFPALSFVTNPIYNVFVNSIVGAYGGAYISANVIVNNVASYCLLPSTIGISVACAACGMSIVYKLMQKKAGSRAE